MVPSSQGSGDGKAPVSLTLVTTGRGRSWGLDHTLNAPAQLGKHHSQSPSFTRGLPASTLLHLLRVCHEQGARQASPGPQSWQAKCGRKVVSSLDAGPVALLLCKSRPLSVPQSPHQRRGDTSHSSHLTELSGEAVQRSERALAVGT